MMDRQTDRQTDRQNFQSKTLLWKGSSKMIFGINRDPLAKVRSPSPDHTITLQIFFEEELSSNKMHLVPKPLDSSAFVLSPGQSDSNKLRNGLIR